MCPHTTAYYICVRIHLPTIYMPSYICLLYICPHTSAYYICVLIHLPTMYVSSYRPLPTIYVSSYIYICVLILGFSINYSTFASTYDLPREALSRSTLYMRLEALTIYATWSTNYICDLKHFDLKWEALSKANPFQIKVLQVAYIVWGHIWQYEDTEDTHIVVVNKVVPATGCQMRPSKSTHFRSKCLKSSPGGNEHSTDL